MPALVKDHSHDVIREERDVHRKDGDRVQCWEKSNGQANRPMRVTAPMQVAGRIDGRAKERDGGESEHGVHDERRDQC